MAMLGAPRRLSPAEKKKSRERRNELRRRRYTEAREQTRPLDEIDLDSVADTIIDRMRKYGVYTVDELDELERRPMQGKGRRLASEGGEEPVQDWIARRRRRMEEGVRALPPLPPEDEPGGGGRRQHRPRRKLMKLRGGGTTYKSEEVDPELEALKARNEQMGAFLDEFFGPEGEPTYAGQSSTESGEYIPGPTGRSRRTQAREGPQYVSAERDLADAYREFVRVVDEEYGGENSRLPHGHPARNRLSAEITRASGLGLGMRIDDIIDDIDEERRVATGASSLGDYRANRAEAGRGGREPGWDPTRRGQPGVQQVTDQVLLDSYDEWAGHMAPGAQNVRDMIWAEIERRDIGHVRAEQYTPAERAQLQQAELSHPRRYREPPPPEEPEAPPRRHREEMTEEEVEGFNQYMADLREGTLRSERAEAERGTGLQELRNQVEDALSHVRALREQYLTATDETYRRRVLEQLNNVEENIPRLEERLREAEMSAQGYLPSQDPRMLRPPEPEPFEPVPESDYNRITEQARREGLWYGRQAASWMIDGNTTDEQLERLARGIGEGDPEILDAIPGPPSGEYADDYNLLQDLEVNPDDPIASDLQMEFEQAHGEGAMRELEVELEARGFPTSQYEPTDEEFTQAREQHYPHPLLGELSNEPDPEVVEELLRRSLEGGLEGGETQASVGGIAPVRSRRFTSRAEGGEAPPEEEPEVTPEQLMEMVRMALAGHLMGGTVRRSAPLPEEPVIPQIPLPPIRPLGQPEANPELAKLLLAFQQAPEDPRFPTPQLRPEGPLINPGINPELLKLLGLGALVTSQ